MYCGRGDRKTERGKRFSHSFGNVNHLSFFFFFNYYYQNLGFFFHDIEDGHWLKIFLGNQDRPRNKNKGRGPPRAPIPPSAPRKDKFDKDDIIKIEIDESFSNS